MCKSTGTACPPATSCAEVIDAHYDAALQSIRLASRHHERHREGADATEGRERGHWQAQADLAMTEWTRSLGAAAALEALADSLGVDLTNDRASREGGDSRTDE